MRIATFNLENLGGGNDEGAAFEDRITVLRPQLERINADVLCLQEANGERAQKGAERGLAALDRLIEDTPYQAFIRVNSVDPQSQQISDRHNLVVLSRWPIRDRRQIWHDFVPPVDHTSITAQPPSGTAPVAWDRPLLYCVVDLPDGSPLHVLNLHLRAPLAAPVQGQKTGPFSWRSASGWAEGYYMAMLKRSGQALEARLLIDRIFDREPEAFIVICGDLNASEREVPARIISAGVDDTGNGDLAGRSLVFLERSVPESRRFSVIHHGQKLMLDHILISHSLLARYRHFEVHNELIGDELFGFANIARNPESYHAPVVAEFADGAS